MAELHDMTALEQAAAVRGRRISPVELVEHYLARIEARNGELGAFVTVTAQDALARAKEAEELVTRAGPGDAAAAARRADRHQGPQPHRGDPDHARLDAVRRLRAAGGRQRRHAAAPGRHDQPGQDQHAASSGCPATPRTRSPAGPHARGTRPARPAAPAAERRPRSPPGWCPFAQGSDGGGSVRIPASVCGLFGIKVSRGRVSNGPVGGDVTGLAWNGPLARSVRDAAALLDAMAGADAGRPALGAAAGRRRDVPVLRRARPGPAADRPVRDPGHRRDRRAPGLPGRVRGGDQGAAPSLGHEVEDVDVAVPARGDGCLRDRLGRVGGVRAGRPGARGRAAAADPVAARARRGDLGRRSSSARWPSCRCSPGSGCCDRAVRRGADARRWRSPPVPVGWFTETGDPAEDFARQKRFTPFTAIVQRDRAAGGDAADALDRGRCPPLPIGVMLAGRPADEATLVSLSAQLEDAVPWVDRHPPGW